jgi:hypothetical protein
VAGLLAHGGELRDRCGKPVDMTCVHEPPASVGDCIRRCIPRILEPSPGDVPYVYDGEGWFGKTGVVGMKRSRSGSPGKDCSSWNGRCTPSTYPAGKESAAATAS